jgi:hypothetical protein
LNEKNDKDEDDDDGHQVVAAVPAACLPSTTETEEIQRGQNPDGAADGIEADDPRETTPIVASTSGKVRRTSNFVWERLNGKLLNKKFIRSRHSDEML